MDLLRDNARELRRKERSKCRESLYNHARVALGAKASESEHISPEQVKAVAIGMKGTLDQLTLLKKAFIQHEDNIKAFIETTGALHILVKQLSGQNASLQLAAAHCCCNLALGDAKQCLFVTKATAPYLISHLDGANSQLVDVCAWTLGNLAASGEKSWFILNDQGASQKLLFLLASPEDEIHSAVVYALSHIVHTGNQHMKATELQSIALVACPLLRQSSSIAWLLFLLSCHSCCDQVFMNHDVINVVLALLPQAGITDATALVRVLANLSSEPSGQVASILLHDSQLSAALSLLNVKEIAWLVGNVANHTLKDIRTRFISSVLREQLEHHLMQAPNVLTLALSIST